MPKLTFSSSQRIRANSDFSCVLRAPKGQTKKIASPYFALLIQKNELNHPRLGIIISKKNVALATERNHLRRVCRESFRIKQYELQNLDIILIIYKTATQVNNIEWRNIIDQHFNQLQSK